MMREPGCCRKFSFGSHRDVRESAREKKNIDLGLRFHAQSYWDTAHECGRKEDIYMLWPHFPIPGCGASLGGCSTVSAGCYGSFGLMRQRFPDKYFSIAVLWCCYHTVFLVVVHSRWWILMGRDTVANRTGNCHSYSFPTPRPVAFCLC